MFAMANHNNMLSDQRVSRVWSDLCGELAICGGIVLLGVLDGDGDLAGEDLNNETKRKLWDVLANTWKGCISEMGVCWEDVVRFLGVPFGYSFFHF
jgi:hypothetical protein